MWRSAITNLFKYQEKGFACVHKRDSFFFFKHLSTSLLFFYMCIYKKEYISHFSAPDNMPLILVTSSIPQATHTR